MASSPVVLVLANPHPEIAPDAANGVAAVFAKDDPTIRTRSTTRVVEAARPDGITR